MPESPQKSSVRTGSAAYDRKREQAKARSAAITLAGQDIGALPPPKNLARRLQADRSFRFFCEAYFPDVFTLAWSPDHLRVITKIETSVIDHEVFAVAMPRGMGKTTLCQIAVLWVILTGLHSYVMLVASTDEYAVAALSNIKSHLSGNRRLLEDYPEAIYPIACLEGQPRRALGQRYYGRPTHISWGIDRIVMPTIPGSRCSGAVVQVSGLTGNIRGALFVRPDGTQVRPSFAVIDDPQTDQSARSPSQVHERLAIINGAIAGLAGPGKRTAMIMPCTVIRAGDLADQLLDREKNPLWQGERTRMVYAFPTNEALWTEYGQIRADSYRNGGQGREATAFYARNRDAMDEGARVAWPERHLPNELSAIQHAMNIRLQDESAFWAEYQNQPLSDDGLNEGAISTDTVTAKANGVPRGVVPAGASHMTVFMDVQKSMIFFMVLACDDDFTAHVVDYGSFPDQQRPYYTLRDAKRTLSMEKPDASLEALILHGLDSVAERLLPRDWVREDGAMLRVDRCLIDANWGESTGTVRAFCRRSKFANLLTPAHGRYVSASQVPIGDKSKARGERVGLNWRVSVIAGQRHAIFDTNFWKSFLFSRISMSMGDRGGLTLFGRPGDHVMLADHLTAERPIRTQAKGRVIDEFKLSPGRDNHFLDCLAGCMVGVSIEGVDALKPSMGAPPKRKPIRLSELRGRRIGS